MSRQHQIITIDTADIAKMLGVTRRHVTERLTKEDGFPSPVLDLSQKVRRWDQRDVLLWFKRRTQKRTGRH